jgi:5-methylcytosine-specific restriction endonuclease McrA
MSLPRTCLRCDTVIKTGTFCIEHQRVEWKIRNDDRRIRKAVVAASPICKCTAACAWHGPTCSATTDLTADHVIPVARGGTNDGPRQVLCRRCNSAKGARR